ncbi:hypothetical protein SELMODRAFT_413502 [Selaginella moellendorffii]|uniref:Uncharacterized protein n=1 Tax=Selaginella moellendorffii TaxID=88036 RepID=D8RPP4_SELML|nr:hypothetical protein SELMODRAFT_413502 [Selaginella moellendorffii]
MTFMDKLMRAVAALEYKAQHRDDLDCEAFNKRPELTLGTNWSMDKFDRYCERYKLFSKCIFRHGRVIVVDAGYTNLRYAIVMSQVSIALQPAVGIPWPFQPKGSNRVVRYLSLGASHRSVIPGPPRIFVSVGEYQTLPELLSYVDSYIQEPGSKLQYLLVLKFYPGSGNRMVAVIYEIVGSGGGEGGAMVTSASAVSFGDEALFPETLAFLAEREIPVTGVGLGGERCDRIGIPSYQIKLATAKVLEGGDLGLPEIRDKGDNLILDLYIIQAAYGCRCL